MAEMLLSPIPIKEEHRATVARLAIASHKNPIDIKTVLPWSQGIDRSIAPKRIDQLWIHGTEYVGQLNDEQKLEVAWKEIARDVSMFIWLEQKIPVLYVNMVHKNMGRLSKEVEEYLMVFSKEEIVHTLMFKRYLEMAGLEMFSQPEILTKLLEEVLPNLAPSVTIMVTMIIEWVAENAVMRSTQESGIEPLTREMFHQHHIDELRHIAFARWLGESYFASCSEEDAKLAQVILKEVYYKLLENFSFNPEIARHTSFEFPVDPNDSEAIARVQKSEHNNQLNASRFADIENWLIKVGVL